MTGLNCDFNRTVIESFFSNKGKDVFIPALEIVFEAVENIWNHTIETRFTDHTLYHSNSIIENIAKLVQNVVHKLTDRESFIFIASAFLHDIGMQYGRFSEKNHDTGAPIIDWNTARKNHAENSVKMIQNLLGGNHPNGEMTGFRDSMSALHNHLEKKRENLITVTTAICDIVRAHTKDSSGRESGWQIVCRQDNAGDLRISLLAALLRLGDELDLSQTRICDWGMFERDEIPSSSLEHWLAAAFVSKAQFINNGTSIVINILPDYTLIPKDKELSEFSHFIINRLHKKLSRSLSKPVIMGEKCIADIFMENGISLRINPLALPTIGRLTMESSSFNPKYYKAIELVYDRMLKYGFSTDAINVNVFGYKGIDHVKLCLIQEAYGLRIPSKLKEEIVRWVINHFSGRDDKHDYHVSFHRITPFENVVEEYLPDSKLSSHSVLGVAAATKAYLNDIKSIRLLPSEISCNTELIGDNVTIKFPKFSRATNFSGQSIAKSPWDIINIDYPLPSDKTNGKNGRKSLKQIAGPSSSVHGLITSLGETTFLVVPCDQQFTNCCGYGAGVIHFFNEFEESRQLSNKDKDKWRRERENLLVTIGNCAKAQYNISGPLVCSFIGYIDTERSYKVIAWRGTEDSTPIPNFLHIGVVASSFLFLDHINREDFKGDPLYLQSDTLPDSTQLKVSLWGYGTDSLFNVGIEDGKICLNVTAQSDSEHKIYSSVQGRL